MVDRGNRGVIQLFSCSVVQFFWNSAGAGAWRRANAVNENGPADGETCSCILAKKRTNSNVAFINFVTSITLSTYALRSNTYYLQRKINCETQTASSKSAS